MFIFTNQVGINIAEEKLQLVELIYKDNKFTLESVDEEYFEEPLFENIKESKFIHILQNAFNEIALRKPIASSQVSISLPLSYFKSFEIPIDKNLTKTDLDEYVNWEFSKLFPEEKREDYAIQKVALHTPDFHTAKRTIVYAVLKNSLKRIHKFCVRNNFSLKNIDNSHIASTAFLQLDQYSSNRLSLFIENRNISFVLFVNRNFIFSKIKNYSNLSEIPFIVNSILEEIKQREFASEEIDEIFISGNVISKELINNIESSTNLSAKLIYPFNYLEISPQLAEHKFVTEQSAKFASAAGMAFRLAS